MRRDFLKLCGLAGLGFACPGGLRALSAATPEQAPYDGPFYMVFNASGGWDTTCLMDAKGVDGINRLYRQGDILTIGNHTLPRPRRSIVMGGSAMRNSSVNSARNCSC